MEARALWSFFAIGLAACSGGSSETDGGGPPPQGDADHIVTDAFGAVDTGGGGRPNDGGGGRDAPGGVDGMPGADVGPSRTDGGMMSSLASLSDNFQGTTLSPSWMMLHGDAANISVHDNALWIQPTRPILWYNTQEGLQLFKMVTGDFKATASVHAHKASAPAQPPDQGPQLGGVMARDPAAPPENYVFIVVGHDMTKVAVETKTTMNSVSNYPAVMWPNGDAELRLCRVGDQFMTYRRAIGDATWQAGAVFTRPDLPATLAVGPNTYAFIFPNGGTPDLVVSFDRFTFADVAGTADCDQN